MIIGSVIAAGLTKRALGTYCPSSLEQPLRDDASMFDRDDMRRQDTIDVLGAYADTRALRGQSLGGGKAAYDDDGAVQLGRDHCGDLGEDFVG